MYVYNSKDEDLVNKNKPTYSLSTLGCIILFLIGWLGFKIIGYIVQYSFLGAIGKDNLFDSTGSIYPTYSAWINFTIYLITLIIILTTFIMLDKVGFIRKIKVFKDKNTYITLITFLAIYFACNYAYALIRVLLEKAIGYSSSANQNQSGLNTMIACQPVLSVIMVVIFAPIVEELTYRQGLFEAIRRKNETLGIIVTVLVFALIHFSFSTVIAYFNYDALLASKSSLLVKTIENGTYVYYSKQEMYYLVIDEIINFPSYVIGGTILTYTYKKHGSVVESILVHSSLNLISVVATILTM